MRRDEKPSCRSEWNLLLCICFDYVIPKWVWLQSVSVRRRLLNIYIYIYTSVYIDIYISGGFNPNSSNGETPKEDSAKPASFSLQSRGFKSSFGAPGEAIVKERNSCGHSLYSQTFLGDCIMSKERPKRNIIQKKYVSERWYFYYYYYCQKCSLISALFKFAFARLDENA